MTRWKRMRRCGEKTKIRLKMRYPIIEEAEKRKEEDWKQGRG